TWDMKPDAPANVRGPFRPARTNVPGIDVGEHFPRMARLADRYALVRSVHHRAAPIHETGHQLMQTGHLFRGGQEYPHYGSVISHLKGRRPEGLPPFVVLPGPVGNTGLSVSHGQTPGYLGAKHDAFPLANAADRFGLRDLRPALDQAQRAGEAALAGRPGAAGEQALGLLFAERTKKAFDVTAERDEV